jgi:hypothetical protein
MTSSNDLAAALDWRKASYSSGNGSCVEVGQTPVGNVAVRDTTDRSGPALAIRPGAWRAFMADIRASRTVTG